MKRWLAGLIIAFMLLSQVAGPLVDTVLAIGKTGSDQHGACPSRFITILNYDSPGVAQISIRIWPGYLGYAISYANYDIFWQNWTDLTFKSGHIYDTSTPNRPDGGILQSYIAETGAGWVSAKLEGTAYLVNGQVCPIPYTYDARNINGTDENVTYTDQQLPLPITADIDNNNVTDDTHCGNICNKKADQLAESQMYDMRDKICYQLKKKGDTYAFNACKSSGKLAIRERESRGWDCWFHVNRNGWIGPTAPENAPPNPDGSAYTGKYFGGCGYHLPVEPTLQAPRPTRSYTNCTILTPVPSGSGYIDCYDDGNVHVQGDIPYVYTTMTPAATVTPLPTMWATATPTNALALNITPLTPVGGDTITVSWSGVTSPATNDWLALYDYETGTKVSSTNATWSYVYTSSCGSSTSSPAKASGSCNISVSTHVPWPGNYVYRLYRNHSNADADLVIESNVYTREPTGCELDPNSCSG